MQRNPNAKDTRKTWDGKPFRILACDPGGTTGWAYCEFNPPHNRLEELEDFRFDCGHFGPGEHHKSLWDFLTTTNFGTFPRQEESIVPLELVCESFEFRQHINPGQAKTKVELISKEYIGIVNLFCQVHNLTPHFQTASSAKSLVPDKGPQANVKLKQLEWYKPVTHWVHAMDAARHLIRYLVINKKIRSPITDKWLRDSL